ncbi:MAG: hypothetical protein IPH78_09845 [Bacteroidetes bacterium]|nr:hypothetical protein [Bacteroidota bacterium]
MNPELNINDSEVSVSIEKGKWRTPYIDETGRICLHESFLSYLWSTMYSIYILFAETIDYPKRNRTAGYEKYPVSNRNIKEAYELLSYAKFLLFGYKVWDKQALPNPEYYRPELHNYIWQTNSLYTYAMTFILSHEFAHAKFHLDKFKGATNEQIFLFEEEADNYAVAAVLAGLPTGYSELDIATRLVVIYGTVTGLLAMFFFKNNTEACKHPRLEDRLLNILVKFPLIDDDGSVWEICCLALRLWDEHFSLGLKWEGGKGSKQQFFSLIRQIKA